MSTTLLIIFGIILLIYLVIAFYFSYSLLYPINHPITETPQDFGMKYEDIEITTKDQIKLKGWYIAAESDKLILFFHPGSFSRAGFDPKNQGLAKITNIKVKFLPTIKQFHMAGFSIIFCDLRNHGNSGKSKNKKLYIGLEEYKDVIAVINYINDSNKLKEKTKAIFSLCTGANASIIAMQKHPELFQDIKCMMAIQPIATNHFIWNLVKDLYTVISAALMVPVVSIISRIWCGKWYKEMSPLNYCHGITCPVFFLQAKTDKWANLEDIQKFYNRAPEPKEILFLEEEQPLHRFDTYNYFGKKPEIALNYFKKYF